MRKTVFLMALAVGLLTMCTLKKVKQTTDNDISKII